MPAAMTLARASLARRRQAPRVGLLAMLGFLLAIQSACNDPAIFLSTTDWPAGTVRLRLRTQIGDQSPPDVYAPLGQSQVVLRLPRGASGPLVLQLEGLDEANCVMGSAELREDVPDGLARYVERQIALSPLVSPACGPPATQTAVSPAVICNAQRAVAITVTGRGFLRVGSRLPSVVFTSTSGLTAPSVLPAETADGCQSNSAHALAEECTTLKVSLPLGALPPDTYRLQVRSANGAASTSLTDPAQPNGDLLVILAPPTVSTGAGVSICASAATARRITGTNFVRQVGSPTGPKVIIDGVDYPTTVADASCTPIVGAEHFEVCTAVDVSTAAGQLSLGSHVARLTNPGDAGCTSVSDFSIDAVGTPTLNAASTLPANPNPRSICTGGGTVAVTGQNMYSGGRLLIGGVPSSSFSVTPTGTGVLQTATGVLGGPIPVASSTDLTVENVPGVAACSATLTNVETVTSGPAILFADPPVVPSAISLQATVYATGVSGQIKEIKVYPAGSTNAVLTFNSTSTPALGLDPTFANRAYITLRTGTLPAGTYDLRLDDMSTCSALLPNAFRVVSTPTLTVTSSTPAFGSTAQNTAVSLAGTGFVSVPRAYLSPNAGTGNAQSISAVTFSGGTSLGGVVRAGLTAQSYDLVVVNPSGAFGIARKAFTVTDAASPPPVVTSVAPGSLVQAVATDVLVQGTGFRNGAVVRMTCYDGSGAVVNGATAGAATVGGTGTTINTRLTAPSGSFYCTINVTNSDGTSFDYSAIGVTGSSLNLTGFKAGSNLTTTRRALAAVAGRPAAVARYVYAIGGDNGTDSAAKSSVEAAPTTLNGTLGTFSVLSQALPKNLSFAGATTIGRFIYVVGGFDGSAGSRSVYRAEILNPLNAPQFADANYLFDYTTGLPGGLYIYRIAAVMGGADPNNPNGETLASDAFPLQLPTLAKGFIQVQLFWPAVPNAASYKIFRTAVNGVAGSERLIATVPHVAGMATQTTTDMGTVTPAGALPLPLGSTGSWTATLPQLAAVRIGPAVAAARDPDPGKSNVWYLYAAGGNSGTLAAPTSLSSVEFLPITLTDTGTVQTQAVGTWTAVTGALTSARWAAPGMPATAAYNNKVFGAATYLYIGGGSTTSVMTLTRNVDVGLVLTGGQITTFSDSGANNLGRPAYGGLVVNNQMMAFGGFQAGVATTSSVTAQMATASTLGNFNSLIGGVLLQPRALQGTAIESAFVYQLGGASAGPNTAQNATEFSVW